jgi:hypothetical protein
LDRVEFFEGRRDLGEFELDIPSNGSTVCSATLQWVSILSDSLMCGSSGEWTLRRTVGLTKEHHEELGSVLKATVGLPYLTKLEASVRGKILNSISLSTEVEEKRTFRVKARQCYELIVDVYQLLCILDIKCEWQGVLGAKKYFEEVVEVRLNQFYRPVEMRPRHDLCGCRSKGETTGTLDLLGENFTVTEPYVALNESLVTATLGVAVENGAIKVSSGPVNDDLWPPSNTVEAHWRTDAREAEERQLRPFQETPDLSLPARALPDYFRFLAGIAADSTVGVKVRVLTLA